MFFGRKKSPPRDGVEVSTPAPRQKKPPIHLPMASTAPAPPASGSSTVPVGRAGTAPGAPAQQTLTLPGVTYTVAIASGKGGVGKSTVSANLAVALAQSGKRVGLLDADIYGPSIPALMGAHGHPDVRDERIVPVEAHGVHMMSLGLLVPGDEPTIWRGPMVGQAVQQLLRDVNWGELDYLLIDLPPGTGDAPLSLSQALRLTGVVVVSTPQDVALNIAVRSIGMFKQLRVPVLGIVENMSYFVCTHCSERHYIFGHGGARKACDQQKVPFLGEIPLYQAIRETGDAGVPIATTAPDAPEAVAFATVSRELERQVKKLSRRSLPILQVSGQ